MNILTKIEFSSILTKIDILVDFEYFKYSIYFEIFRKFLPKSLFLKIFTEIEILGKFWIKSRYLQIMTLIEFFF